ncbi:MAG TPA: hypothetical protein DDW36_03150, partial [Candidatus Magasanikbacteria bacterium]|nr:hypothetical protein [Candidatus Magasanikbacteria bacterium]
MAGFLCNAPSSFGLLQRTGGATMSTTEKQLRVRINKDGVTCAPECKAIVETFTPVRLVLIAREAANANVLVVWDAEHEPGCIEFYGLAPQQELAVVQFVLDEARRM